MHVHITRMCLIIHNSAAQQRLKHLIIGRSCSKNLMISHIKIIEGYRKFSSKVGTMFNNPIEFVNIRSLALRIFCTQLCNERGCYEHPTGFLRADHFHSEIIPYTRIYNNNNIKNTIARVCILVILKQDIKY